MASVYLETSFISACVTTRSDVASVYRREASREWWTAQANHHELFISAEVVAELSHPSYPQKTEALELVREVRLLRVDDDVRGFGQLLVAQKLMPARLAGDAIHLAVACVHRMDYLLSWNVKHLANPNKLVHLQAICVRLGMIPPRILTPDLLWEETDASD